MNILELFETRYTTKKYDADKRISSEKIEKLKQILRLSPSSINSQPWQFTFVSDPELKRQLAFHSHFNKEKIENASHLVVFSCVDDMEFFSQEIKTYLPEFAIDYYNQKRKQFSVEYIKNWLSNQVYLALGVFLTACAALKIDSTAMEGIDQKAYTEILGDKRYKVLFAVAIGYRAEDDINQLHLKPKQRRDKKDVIVEK